MTVTLKKPEALRDKTKVGDHLGQALVELAWANGPGVLSSLRAAIGDESLAAQSVEERAYTWVWSSLRGAVLSVLHDNRIAENLNAADVADALIDFETDVFPETIADTLDANALVNPVLLPVIDRAAEVFPRFLHRVAPNNGLDEDESRNLLKNAFWQEAGHIYTHESEFYTSLTKALTGPAATGGDRELAWMRHAKWIRGLWERDPIFGQEPESGLSLSKVYERLRCFWHVEQEIEDGDTRQEPKKKRIGHVNELHETMHDWLNGGADRDRLRLVTGGPGCGKSSFARAFAVEVIEAQTHRVIFIPLQNMALGGDLHQSIGTYLRRTWHATRTDGGGGFHENPLDWVGQDTRPILLIFDGLDELSPSQAKANELTRKFVQTVSNLIRTMVTVRAVVLGRPAAMQEAMDEVEFDLPKEALLHVAKLTPLDDSDIGNPDQTIATDDLMQRDQRTGFWQRWTALSGGDTGTIPPAITDESMGELNAEPLLLYLLILSGYAEAKWEEARDNRNVVYRKIFAEVYQRSKDKDDGSLKDINKPDFFGLMECLGLAAWRGNGRTGTDEQFEALRDLHLLHRKKDLQDVEAATLRGAAVNFYTRKDLGGDAGFEFIHKSFGEYLAARGLLNFALRLAKGLEQGVIDEADAALRWVNLIDVAELSDQVIRFAYDEAKILHHEDAEDVSTAKTTLVDLFSWTLEHGMPAHLVNDCGPFRQVETRQRCAEAALLAVASSCASSLPVEDGDGHLVTPTWPAYDGVRETLDRLKVSHQRTPDQFLQWLSMTEAELIGANLFLANLNGAYLNGAYLNGAHLNRAELNRAELIGANLFLAHLNRAELIGGNLRDANLNGAHLNRAELRDANLREAELNGAHLNGANLELADCNRVRIDSARLQSASLMGAKNLTQAQIDSADGNSETILPDGLVRPAHWQD